MNCRIRSAISSFFSALAVAALCGAVFQNNARAACLAPPAGLVGWWQAEGDAYDTIGGNNGVLLHNTGFTNGEVGQAFVFDGITQLVEIPDAPALNPPVAMTLEAWIFISGFGFNDSIAVVNKDDPNSDRQYMIGMGNASGHWAFRAHLGTSGTYHFFDGTTALQSQTWYHVGMTYDGSTLKLFVNGALDGSRPVSGPITISSNPLRIGGHAPGPWNFYGFVDEVSLYDRSLGSEEILAIYNAGAAGKCTNPLAPAVHFQPTNQTVFASQTVTFSVGASGSRPLSYQWTLDAAAVAGATDRTLTITNVLLAQAGTYAVQITNSAGSVVSSNAILTVNPPPPCLTPAPGLMSWWQAEGSPADETGMNNASLVSGVSYAPGMVGRAFALDGNGSYVQVADSRSLDLTNELTVELWYKDTGCRAGNYFYGLMAKRAPYPAGANFGLSLYLGPQSYLQAYLQDPAYYGYQNTTCPVPTAGTFHHVAATYSQMPSNVVQVKLYVDGQLASTGSLNANLARTLNTAPVIIGADDRYEDYFTGLIDEPTIYHRALPDSEILAIYNAAVSGKCPVPLPVAIYAQPADQSVTVGQTVTFTVGVSGTAPISYQWNLNGQSIAGATDASLVLNNIQRTQAGFYSVNVSNAQGSAMSSNALLTVHFPPANVQIVSAVPGSDGSLSIPILIAANGNENALGCTLDFSPTLLSYTSVSLGTGAAGGALFANTNMLADGKLGLAISLPADATFAAGTQEVAIVSFTTAVISNATTTQLVFGDQPTTRQLSDPEANSLAVTFSGASLVIPAAEFEGDVAPRPGGDRTLSITDWVLVGRYAARLDYPTNASEYQRADCAPRITAGDGAITVADWVQAGRYAAGIDPVARAGGPTNDVGPMALVSSGVEKTGSAGGVKPKGLNLRQVRVVRMDLAPGQAGTVSVLLEAQGNENGAGFSFTFDPRLLSYTGATLGSGATAASMDVNATQAAAGKLAFVLALPVGGSFSTGTRELVKLSFTAGAGSGTGRLALTDQLAIRQVVDASAGGLASDFVDGALTVNSLPALSIAGGRQIVTLSWPLWATNFVLQEADTALLPTLNWTNAPLALGRTNNEATVAIPAAGTAKFYRLQKQP